MTACVTQPIKITSWKVRSNLRETYYRIISLFTCCPYFSGWSIILGLLIVRSTIQECDLIRGSSMFMGRTNSIKDHSRSAFIRSMWTWYPSLQKLKVNNIIIRLERYTWKDAVLSNEIQEYFEVRTKWKEIQTSTNDSLLQLHQEHWIEPLRYKRKKKWDTNKSSNGPYY